MLSYDDKISKYLPDFPRGDKITVLQLLLHKSGVPNPDYVATFHKDLPVNEVVKTVANKPLDFEPGTSNKYSNGGYLLLAAIVERLSGKPTRNSA